MRVPRPTQPLLSPQRGPVCWRVPGTAWIAVWRSGSWAGKRRLGQRWLVVDQECLMTVDKWRGVGERARRKGERELAWRTRTHCLAEAWCLWRWTALGCSRSSARLGHRHSQPLVQPLTSWVPLARKFCPSESSAKKVRQDPGRGCHQGAWSSVGTQHGHFPWLLPHREELLRDREAAVRWRSPAAAGRAGRPVSTHFPQHTCVTLERAREGKRQSKPKELIFK